jgi:hypothetical protein
MPFRKIKLPRYIALALDSVLAPNTVLGFYLERGT